MDKLLNDLKKLKDIYYETEEVTLGKDLKIKLKLLTSEEETEAHAEAMVYEQGLAYLYSIKRETLVRAIISLNDTEIPPIVTEVTGSGATANTENIERYVWLRKNIVKFWNQLIIDTAWNGYNNLMVKLENKLDVKTEKNKENE